MRSTLMALLTSNPFFRVCPHTDKRNTLLSITASVWAEDAKNRDVGGSIHKKRTLDF